jgi:serine/threonine protein kinase
MPVARKWFPYTPDFDREFLFLETLNSPPNRCHDRIMKHLAVVMNRQAGIDSTAVDKYSLLFPLADFDLDKYLSTENFSRFEFKDLMKELYHLADALSFLHHRVTTSGGASLVGSHMDLNPRNILIFLSGTGGSPTGIWKITDFSNSTLTDEAGHDYSPPPKLVPEIYMAPEIQIPIEENKAHPACDIWSLGCIIFEVLVGYVEGKECKSWKDKHGNSRCYYEKEGEEMRIESRVWKWLNANVTNDAVGMCKQLVMDMLRINPKDRLTAEQVRVRLEMLFK